MSLRASSQLVVLIALVEFVKLVGFVHLVHFVESGSGSLRLVGEILEHVLLIQRHG